MFAAEPVAPKIKIRTFLNTDSVITCFVCCLQGTGTKIVITSKLDSLRLTSSLSL